MKFIQPSSILELVQALAQMSGPNCFFVSGCTDFLTKRNRTAWDAELLVSLVDVPELKTIEENDGVLSIGAACTHTQVEEHPLAARYFPALTGACGEIGSKQIRNRGTIGGSIANASPAGDIYPVLTVLGAQAVILDSSGSFRHIPIEDLVLGKERTALAYNEVIVSFELPLPAGNNLNAFVKLGDRSHVTIAKINLAVSAQVEDGVLHHVKTAIGAVGERAFASRASGVLEGRTLSRQLLPEFYESLSQDIQNSIPDRASMPYKRQAVRGIADDMLDQLIKQLENRR